MSKIVKQNGFKFGWKRLAVKPTISLDGYYAMRGWQTDAFITLSDEQYTIINAPMGSGKSKLMCWISVHSMQKDPDIRCIIAVPQTSIGDGFIEENLIMPDSKKFTWMAQHDLCNEQPSEGTIKYVINWLQNPHAFFQDRILLCTHATLVNVYKRLKDENRLYILKDLLLWIDEAHHLKNANVEGFDDAIISNAIGELVTYLMGRKSVHIGLATASFFRGDRMSLLTEKTQKQFRRFDLPVDEYLKSMEHLESFSFDFVLCGPNFTKAIEVLAKHRRGKDIVYIPHPMSKDSTGNKHKEVEGIVEKYKKVYGGRLVNQDGLTLLCRKDGDFKIVNLVEDRTSRDRKKEYIRNIKFQKDALDSIITLGMFKEGANWIWADRGIIIGARTSLLDVFQMVGRVFRDAKSKLHVEIIQVLPFASTKKTKRNFVMILTVI